MLQLPPLYALTDAHQDRSLAEQIRHLGEMGFPLVQFRGKPLDARVQWEELRRALEVAAAAGGWPRIVVNDRADLAVLAARERLAPWGLHLGQDDLPPSEARRLPGLEGAHLGTSTHFLDEWQDVDPACDHAGVGPFRGTASKGDHAAPIGLDGLREGCRRLRARDVAPVAIGGLTVEDLPEVFAAGAESAAMIGTIARAEDPEDLLWRAQVLRWRARPLVRSGQGIVLAGGSGSGKSTLGATLEDRSGLPFLDLDAVIETAEGRTIPSIFSEKGEDAFRDLEVRYAREALGSPCILALGGGAWEQVEIRETVTASCFAALWLAEVPLRAWARVGGDPARPLAQSRDVFLERYRRRTACWSLLPPVLPLRRPAEVLADALLFPGETEI